MRYEIEQAGAGDGHRPDVDTHAEPVESATKRGVLVARGVEAG
jgi:hypothetical protein